MKSVFEVYQPDKLYQHKDLPDARILLHPNIPKPLHGVNPRSVLGQTWWDEHRREAYVFFDYRCWACGVEKRLAKYHQWLEGHEYYKVDYNTGELKLFGIVALCHSCHNFIHSGRMFELVRQAKMRREKFLDIHRHGYRILKQAGLPLNPFSIISLRKFRDLELQPSLWPPYEMTIKAINYINGLSKNEVPWNEWHMIIEGKAYYSPHQNIEEWQEFYSKAD